MRISELFYSIQGEGQRAGTANVFVRTQGCKTQHACYAAGIRCDTNFESGREYSIKELHDAVYKLDTGRSMNIIWTGGEPLDQLLPEHVNYFREAGYYQALETSGLRSTEAEFDYVCVSPKVAEHVVAKNFEHVNELRYVVHSGQEIPNPSIRADYLSISPHSDGMRLNADNVAHCVQLVLQNPTWRLSVQQHKLWGVL